VITSNIIHRVFQVSLGRGTGTAFTIQHDDTEYLVTAAHVVEGIGGAGKLQIMQAGEWIPHEVHWAAAGTDGRDVAVLKIGAALTPKGLPAPASDEGLIYGQDVYFLGFPYGWVGDHRINRGFPLPFVKRATMSLFDGPSMYLDGHNNPGFSGGPVVFKRPGNNQWQIAGVISGYRYAREPIHRGDEITEYSSAVNTGIIISYGIGHVLELIAARHR
jgi:S1-C subfamily serine protease